MRVSPRDDLLHALLHARDQTLHSVLEEVLEQWRKAPQQGTWILSQLAKAKELQLCHHVLQAMQENHLEVSTVHFNCVLSACARKRQWAPALMLLTEMEEIQVAYDTISFSSAINACGAIWQLALALLEKMEDQQVQLDTIALNSLVSSCEKQGRWNVALDLMSNMQASEAGHILLLYL
eukprot:g14051.t1